VSEPVVLVVDDDAALGDGLQQALRAQGYDAHWAATGREAVAFADHRAPELILLDLGLPDVDGLEVCRTVRSRHPDVVIVMVTARHDEVDTVVGLDAGADDYVTKPFRLAELLARLRAHLRRVPSGTAGDTRVVGDISVDAGARRAWLAGNELALRPREFDLLALLVDEAGQALTRDRIMATVWDEHWYGSTKTLDMHISALRRKLGERGEDGSRITTLRGVGYRLELT